jgi:hypothetical protein
MMGDYRGEYCYKVYQGREEVCDGCPIALAFKDGKSHTVQKEEHMSEATRYVEITASPIRDTKGEIIAGIEIVRDITKRIKAGKELKEKIKELEDFYDIAVGRELRNIELKKEISQLKKELEKYKKQ